MTDDLHLAGGRRERGRFPPPVGDAPWDRPRIEIDDAEVFATLLGPLVDGWRALTTRPAPALAALEAQFFTAG